MAANYRRRGVILLLLVLVLFYVYVIDLNVSQITFTARTNNNNNVLLAAAVATATSTTSFTQKTTKYSDLKSLAYSQMKENAKQGLPLPVLPMEHYSISKFQLSPGHAAGFSFEFQNAAMPSKLLNDHTDNDNDRCVKKIICRIHKNTVNHHFPHFAQDAFPCFSAFQQVMRMVKSDHMNINTNTNNSTSNVRREMKIRFILQLVIPKKEKMNHFSNQKWNADLIKAFGQTGIEVSTVQKSEDGTIIGKKWSKSEIDDGDCDWIVSLVDDSGTSGWAPRKDRIDPRDGKNTDASVTMSRWPIENAKYFSTQNDMEIVQKGVLKKEFQHGPSDTIPIRVLILDRALTTRHWLYAAETKKQLESAWGLAVEVRIVSNPRGSLLGQAREFHSADIIISSHGAQLANLAFIRPCTVVVELFPYAYYLGFFQAFALAADGISFDAYPFDASPLKDSEVSTPPNGRERGMRRGIPLQASPESIVHAFPIILLEMMTCRENWKGVLD